MGTNAEAKTTGRRGVAWFCISLLVLVLFVLSLPILLMTGGLDLAVHLLAGFWFFLSENLPRITPNAATWAPGVAALLLAVVGLHFFLRPWAVKRGKRWPLGNSVALAAAIPVLFVIAFLVPGILLQAGELAAMPRWFHREQGKGNSSAENLVRSYSMVAFMYSQDHDGKFPDTAAELPVDSGIRHLQDFEKRGQHYWDRDLPRESVIYLGGGLTIGSDPSLALAISPPFSGSDGRMRYVATIVGEVKLIPADEAELWIQRSLEARRAAPPPSP